MTMRVLWVQDYVKQDGGAEQSNKAVVHVGTGLGFDIVGMSPRHFQEKLLRDADVVIVNNFHQFGGTQVAMVRSACVEGNVPLVMYSHDYRDLKRRGFILPFFLKARLNVFISPKHLQDYSAAFLIERCVALPLCIDTKGFTPVEGVVRRPRSVLIVAPQKQGTQTEKFICEHPEYTYCSIGMKFPGCREVRPVVPIKSMPRLYSEFDCLLHFPKGLCGGERILFEAALCGCKLWSNANAGHTSWGFDWTNRVGLARALDEAPFAFWKQVEEVVG